MKYAATFASALAIAIVFLVASCGGGGGHRSLTPGVTTPPATTPATTGSDESTTKPPSPSPYTGAPRTVADTEYVLVKTGDTPEEFAPIAAKFGYEVEYKTGNWLKVRVPDGNIDRALTELRKEYVVFDAQPLRKYVMPREEAPPPVDVKLASYLPFDTLYNDRAIMPSGATPEGDVTYSSYFSQRAYMAPMSFEGAWDVAWRDDIRTVPVTVAIIDAGIYYDSGNDRYHPELDSARVAAGSGTVAGDGTFTPDEYAYELDDGVPPAPYRTTGNRLTGLFLSTVNNIISWTTQVGDPPQDASFVASLAPIAPFADVMIIKTGHLETDTWAFSDDEIASSIQHAVDNGANIILLGMWAVAGAMPPVAPVIQDQIDYARASDVLVVAPAGMADLDTSAEDPSDWTWGVAGDASGVTPAAGVGVVSVMGTGFEQLDGDHDPPYDPGYANAIFANIGDAWNEIAEYSFTGGTMAAVGWGTSWSGNFFNIGINVNTSPGGPGNVDVAYAAAYVAGAASIAYQALTNANGGTPPTDVDTVIENLLLDEALTLPTSEKFLAAGRVAQVAAEGGYNKIINPVNIESINISGGDAAFRDGYASIETLQEVQFAAHVTGSEGGLKLKVYWGDGTSTPEGDAEPVDYVSDDPIAHTYSDAGVYVIRFQAQDASSNEDWFSIHAKVYNGLSATLQIFDSESNLLTGTPVALDFDGIYLIDSQAQYDVETGNAATFEWDFDWDGDPANFDVDVNTDDLQSVLFSYDTAPGGYTGPIKYLDKGPIENTTIGLRVTQTLRPTVYFSIDVSVN